MSEDQDKDSKTEEPSAKRLTEAESKGQYAISREIAHASAILGALVLVAWCLPWILGGLEGRLAYYIAEADQITTDAGGIRVVLDRAMNDSLWALWLPLILLMALGVLSTGLQTGFGASFELLQPKFEKINPLNGFKRYFQLVQQAVDLGKSLAKLIVVGAAAYFVLLPMFEHIELFAGMDIMGVLADLQDKAFALLTVVLIVTAAIAAADYAYTAYQHYEKLKMTKQEVKDEAKQQEGDPHIKARLRQLRFEKARRRMMANVPKADVVVTNPTHYAVAMKYEAGGSRAPVVLAKGVDQVALRIRELAEEHRIPIVRNPPLARTLYDTVELDQEIHPDQYRAVAEIISYVFKLRGQSAKR